MMGRLGLRPPLPDKESAAGAPPNPTRRPLYAIRRPAGDALIRSALRTLIDPLIRRPIIISLTTPRLLPARQAHVKRQEIRGSHQAMTNKNRRAPGIEDETYFSLVDSRGEP